MSDYVLAFVDDEIDLIEAYKELFETKYQVKTFDCAENYLNYVIEQKRNPFNCTITDFKMGDLNGVQMINKTIELNLTCPFILLSGHLDSDLLQKLSDKSAQVTLLEKPPEIKILYQLIKKIVGRVN